MYVGYAKDLAQTALQVTGAWLTVIAVRHF